MNINRITENQKKYAMQAELMKLYSQYGFRQIAIPACESAAALNELEKKYPVKSQVRFMDQSGEIFHLQNDPTLSVMKMLRFSQTRSNDEKICYYAPTYKWSNGQLKEETQIGIEAFGTDTETYDLETIVLAIKSLRRFTEEVALDIGDVTLLSMLLKGIHLSEAQTNEVYKALPTKNVLRLQNLPEFYNLSDLIWEQLSAIFKLYGPQRRVIGDTRALLETMTFETEATRTKAEKALKALSDRATLLEAYQLESYVQLDLTLSPELPYYNGLVLKGFIGGCPSEVLTGGRYDKLSKDFGKAACAIGFALTLDNLMKYTEVKKMTRKNTLLLLENTLSAKGIEYAELYRQRGFEVNLRTYDAEKEAIEIAEAEQFEKVIVFQETTAKIIDIRKNDIQKVPYTTFENYLKISEVERGIH